MDNKVQFKHFYGTKTDWLSRINSNLWKDSIVFGRVKDEETNKWEYKIYAGSVNVSISGSNDTSVIHYIYDTGIGGGPSSAHIDVSTCNPEDYYLELGITPAHGDYYIKEEYVVFKDKTTGDFIPSDDQNAEPDKTVDPRRTAYIFNASLHNGDGAWQALDGNVDATNVYFKDGVGRTAAIGKWKEEDEEKIEGLGMNLKELLEYYLLAKKFKIKFYDASFYGTDDGKFEPSLYNTQSINENSKPVAPANPGTKTTPKYTYNFIKWVPDLVDAVADTSYNASYGWSINKYKITWNWFTDGGNSGTPQKLEPLVEYDATPAPPSIPLTYKTNASVYTLKDSSWTPEIVKVIGTASYNASYNVVTRQYNIRWRDGNGNPYPAGSPETSDVSVNWGITPVAPAGTPPVPAATAKYTFVANNSWTPNIHPVNGDQVYNASYNWIINKYTITWNNWNGDELEVDTNVPYDSAVSYNGATPTKDMTEASTFTFNGWQPSTHTVTGDETYTAKFQEHARKYKIDWYKENSYIDNTSVAWHTMPTHSIPSKADSADGHYRYEFAAWTPTLSSVTGDTSYNATYNAITKSYTVYWKNGDNVTIETDTNVAWGTTTSYDGTTPTKSPSNTCSYVFNGHWYPDPTVPIKGNTTYNASFNEVSPPKVYTNGVSVTIGTGSSDASNLSDCVWSNNPQNPLHSLNPNGDTYAIGFGGSDTDIIPYVYIPVGYVINDSANIYAASRDANNYLIGWTTQGKSGRKVWNISTNQITISDTLYNIYYCTKGTNGDGNPVARNAYRFIINPQ